MPMDLSQGPLIESIKGLTSAPKAEDCKVKLWILFYQCL